MSANFVKCSHGGVTVLLMEEHYAILQAKWGECETCHTLGVRFFAFASTAFILKRMEWWAGSPDIWMSNLLTGTEEDMEKLLRRVGGTVREVSAWQVPFCQSNPHSVRADAERGCFLVTREDLVAIFGKGAFTSMPRFAREGR